MSINPRHLTTLVPLLVLLAAAASCADPATGTDARHDHQAQENRRLAWGLWQREKDDVAAALKAGADPNARFAAWQYEDFQGDAPPALKPQKASPKYDHFWRNSLLVLMCVQNSYYVSVLKEAGADVDARNSDGDTVLHLISRCLNDQSDGRSNAADVEDGVRLLVSHGADVNARNDAGQTVLQSLQSTVGAGKIIAALKALGARSDGASSGRVGHTTRKNNGKRKNIP